MAAGPEPLAPPLHWAWPAARSGRHDIFGLEAFTHRRMERKRKGKAI